MLDSVFGHIQEVARIYLKSPIGKNIEIRLGHGMVCNDTTNSQP